MTEIEQVYEAITAADAAGDTASLQELIPYMQTLEAAEASVTAPTATTDPTVTPSPEAPQKPQSYAEELMQFPDLIPDAIGGFLEATEERQESREETGRALVGGKLTPDAAAASIGLSVTAGTAVDVLTGVIGLGIGTASLLIPDAVGQPVADQFKATVKALGETDLGQWAVDALSGGVEHYAEVKKQDPEGAKLLEGVVNVAMLMSPSPKAKPTMGNLTATGQKIINSGERGHIVHKRKFVDDILTPVVTKQTKLDDLPNTSVSPITQKATVAKTSHQVEMADVVAAIPDFKPTNTVKANDGVLRREVRKKGDDLIILLEKTEKNRAASVGYGGKLQTEVVVKRLSDDVSELIATNPLFRGDKSITGAAEAMLEKTVQLLSKKDITPANVLRVRRELDEFIRSSKGSVFDSATENAVSLPFKTIRKTLNDIVDEAVPNVKVKESLRSQTMIFNAMDVIAPKAAEESATILGRAVQNTMKVLPVHSVRDMAVGAVALGIAPAVNPALGILLPVVAGGLGLYGTSRLLAKNSLPSKSKIEIGKVLQRIDKAIKVSKDSAMIKTLHADRIYIADMLKNIDTDDSDVGVPELLKR